MGKVLVVGSSVVDLTFYSDRIPLIGETVLGRFVQGLGGKGFNQAVGSALAGAQTSFISAVGEDAFAPLFRNRLQELRIEASLETLPGEATGAAAISVDRAGGNSITVALGANARLTPAFLSRNEKQFDDVSVLLLQFETNLEVVDAALKLARKRSPGVIAILNPAPALPKIPAEILGNVDYLTPNESELETISGQKLGSDFSRLPQACGEIPVRGAVLATLGERGCAYFKKAGSHYELEKIPAFPVQAKDTSGAGDAFNGAFAAALLNSSWKDAARFASAAAAISVTRPGTSASMARLDEISQFLKQRGSSS